MTYPTREEWAYRKQHPYWDDETGCPFEERISHQLSDYATAKEIADAIVGLEDLWRQYGRRMRELKAKGSPLYRQPGEDRLAHQYRCIAMSPEELDIACEPDELKSRRHFIRQVIVGLRENKLPPFYETGHAGKEANTLIAAFRQRYDAAYKAVEEQWNREQLLNPVDDAAWEQELQRRKRIEDYLAHPEKRIHHI